MQKVTGIGGVFFRARDPDALVRWYAEHLGVAPPPASYGEPSWWQEAGPTIFTAMSADSEHFERPEQSWAINFRVGDLDALVAQLRAAGIGGVFFRARDPDALVRWYAQHLGVAPPPASYGEPSWWQEAGPTIFTAMSADSEHFERPEQSWAINFRVGDLDALVAQLRAAGIGVDADPQTYPNGRFASTRDPEGNPIQLWEPAGVDG